MQISQWLVRLQQRLAATLTRNLPTCGLLTRGMRGRLRRAGLRTRQGQMAHCQPLELRTLLALGVIDLSGAQTATQLAQSLAGAGVIISNVVYTGSNLAGGSFTNGLPDGLGLDAGVILSSGGVLNAIGPNNTSSKSTGFNTAGDTDLNLLIAPKTTKDAAILEFDFIPTSSLVAFDYVFASEEYKEFVGSSFDDVFGFFVNGTNVAVVPGTTTRVSINTISHLTNSSLFKDNPTALPIFGTQFDGFTTVLQAKATVIPGILNHMKLAIADSTDTSLDSAVFLKAGSIVSHSQAFR